MRAFPEDRAGGGDVGPADAAGDPEVRLSRWAERWGLTALLDATDTALSGGEKNRAGVALAVLRRPVCLLTDEPLTNSAPKDRERICEALRTLRDRGCALVVTGHEARELLALADRVIWMVAGTTRDLGRTEAALTSHQFRREYLGPSFPPPGRDRAAGSGAVGPTPRPGVDAS
jgi:ABC-type lipopolysaccharide export system ATPase subunit